MAPVMEELKYDLGEKIRIVQVDLDQCPEALHEYHVNGTPTMILFKKGQQIWRHSGVVPKQMLMHIIHATA
jgi:thioredoxin 1